MKRILVTGSRDWDDVKTIETALRDAYFELCGDTGLAPDVVLVHGACHLGGADIIARDVWLAHGLPDEPHPAEWFYGRLLGPKRNQEMVDLGADVCLAFPKGESRGTRDCMRRAEAAGIRVINYGDAA